MREKGKKVDLKYKSPLVNSVPWYNDRLYRVWSPNHAVLLLKKCAGEK